MKFSSVASRVLLPAGRVVLILYLGLLAFANVHAVIDVTAGRLDGVLTKDKPEDMLSFYSAGMLVREGRVDDIYDPDVIAAEQEKIAGHPTGGVEQGLPFFNPPFVAVAFAPLSVLSIGPFTGVLFVLVFAAVIGGGILADRVLSPVSRSQRFILWAGYLSAWPVSWLLLEQQLTMFVFIAWIGFAILESKGLHRWSGACLALALVKPQSLFLLLPILIWKRQWTTLRAFVLAGAPLALISILVAGPEILIEYPRFLLESTKWEGRGVNALGMFSFNGFAANIIDDGSPPAFTYLPLALLTVVSVAVAWRRVEWRPNTASFKTVLAATFIAAMLTNPHFYLQDVTLAVVPLVLLISARGRRFASDQRMWLMLAGLWWVARYGPELQGDYNLAIITPILVFGLIAAYFQLSKLQDERTLAPSTNHRDLVEAQAA